MNTSSSLVETKRLLFAHGIWITTFSRNAAKLTCFGSSFGKRNETSGPEAQIPSATLDHSSQNP
jgi:hypothetical protein